MLLSIIPYFSPKVYILFNYDDYLFQITKTKKKLALLCQLFCLSFTQPSGVANFQRDNTTLPS